MFGFNVSKATVSVRQCGKTMGGVVLVRSEVADADDDMFVLKGRGQLEDVVWLVGCQSDEQKTGGREEEKVKFAW